MQGKPCLLYEKRAAIHLSNYKFIGVNHENYQTTSNSTTGIK